MLKSNFLLVGGSIEMTVVLMTAAVNGLVATALMAEPMPLPAPGSVSTPWIERVFLAESDVSPEEAVRFRIIDDAEVGRALVVGPWLSRSVRPRLHVGGEMQGAESHRRVARRTLVRLLVSGQRNIL